MGSLSKVRTLSRNLCRCMQTARWRVDRSRNINFTTAAPHDATVRTKSPQFSNPLENEIAIKAAQMPRQFGKQNCNNADQIGNEIGNEIDTKAGTKFGTKLCERNSAERNCSERNFGNLRTESVPRKISFRNISF